MPAHPSVCHASHTQPHMFHDSTSGSTSAHKGKKYEPALDAEKSDVNIPCGAGALAGRLLPGLRIQAGSAFSLTAKPARFLASAACQAARDTIKVRWATHPYCSQWFNAIAWPAGTSRQGIMSGAEIASMAAAHCELLALQRPGLPHGGCRLGCPGLRFWTGRPLVCGSSSSLTLNCCIAVLFSSPCM